MRTENGVVTRLAVERITLDGQVYLVMAANGTTGGSSGSGPKECHGMFLTVDGRRIPWTCDSQDGRTGKVVVDGTTFDLAAGNLFLVSAKENPVQIEQVAVDPTRLAAHATTDKFPGLADLDPKIAAFLESCKTPE